jgi:hypothetical protein
LVLKAKAGMQGTPRSRPSQENQKVFGGEERGSGTRLRSHDTTYHLSQIIQQRSTRLRWRQTSSDFKDRFSSITTFPNYHQIPSIGGGIRVVKTKRGLKTCPWPRTHTIPLVEVIDAINVATGSGIGGRQVEGLDKMTFADAYNTFMKLPEFEEE